MKKAILLSLIIPFFSYSAQQNFTNAKSQLLEIYKHHPEQKDFYCNCDLIFKGKKGVIDLKSCGYSARKNELRAKRMEWEHVMPAENFGHQLQCWKDGGRKNCKKDIKFKTMEGDMHNLQPAIGEVNGDRSNYGYSQFTKRFDQYGQCKVATDFKNKKFQPRAENHGVIARTYLYMSNQYGITLSKQEKQLMSAWDKMNPPKIWECERNKLIKKIQGHDNFIITKECRENYH